MSIAPRSRKSFLSDYPFGPEWYMGLYSKQEIERIYNIRNGEDYLLKLRADTLTDHPRYSRVFYHLKYFHEKQGNLNWSPESYFRREHYAEVLRKLPEEYRLRCQAIYCGDIFTSEPNGIIYDSGIGIICSISKSLNFFLKFFHLAILDFGGQIPISVKFNSLRIAVRTMLQTESMDFLLDPRGIVPENIVFDIHKPISDQLKFIVGHEFAHCCLGHLSVGDMIEKPILQAVGQTNNDYGFVKVFNNSQKQELEADIFSILIPKYNMVERSRILNSAILWFIGLALYEVASDYISPASPLSVKTHPSAIERIENLISKSELGCLVDKDLLNSFESTIKEYSALLIDDIGYNIEAYEDYGSIYLGEPNTEWRGKELIDRIDY
ncbi:MAG: M48 family metalloprotease [Deferribacterales bacterium]